MIKRQHALPHTARRPGRQSATSEEIIIYIGNYYSHRTLSIKTISNVRALPN